MRFGVNFLSQGGARSDVRHWQSGSIGWSGGERVRAASGRNGAAGGRTLTPGSAHAVAVPCLVHKTERQQRKNVQRATLLVHYFPIDKRLNLYYQYRILDCIKINPLLNKTFLSIATLISMVFQL